MAAGPQFLLNTSAEIGAGIIYSGGNRRTLFAIIAALDVCVGCRGGGGGKRSSRCYVFTKLF